VAAINANNVVDNEVMISKIERSPYIMLLFVLGTIITSTFSR
jgi:hypothetical protein